MKYVVISFVIMGVIVWAVVSLFEWLGNATKQFKARISIDTSKTIVERNQDLIQQYLGTIYAGSEFYYVDNKVRDCIGAIANREGLNRLVPEAREWLSVWQNRSDIPKEYLDLKDHLKDLFKHRFDERQEQARHEYERRQEQARLESEAKRDREGEKLFVANIDLIEKFFEIAERKVSILDDYGDENWSVLEKEIEACIEKIATRANIKINWKKYRSTKRRWFYSETGTLLDGHSWLKVKLEERFRRRHAEQSKKPVPDVDINSLDGIEFEAHIARKLKENGFQDVRGTPASGDQGADLIARHAGKTIIIQAKRYQGTVGNKAVQEVASAVNFYDGDEGWVITNSTFSPAAKALAQKTKVRLIDGRDLERIDQVLKAI